MKIPVVLSVVHVAVDADGVMAVDVDGVPRDSGQSRTRGDLRAVIMGSPQTRRPGASRGTRGRWIDVLRHRNPPESPAPAAAEPSPTTSTPSLAGDGFLPGEEVALAYVIVGQNADAAGNASLNLPPALLAASRGGLVLLGTSSRTVTLFEAPA